MTDQDYADQQYERVLKRAEGAEARLAELEAGLLATAESLQVAEAENERLTSALDRLFTNARFIFDKKPVRDWSETLAEAESALGERGK